VTSLSLSRITLITLSEKTAPIPALSGVLPTQIAELSFENGLMRLRVVDLATSGSVERREMRRLKHEQNTCSRGRSNDRVVGRFDPRSALRAQIGLLREGAGLE
jgi:hypothetical protein